MRRLIPVLHYCNEYCLQCIYLFPTGTSSSCIVCKEMKKVFRVYNAPRWTLETQGHDSCHSWSVLPEHCQLLVALMGLCFIIRLDNALQQNLLATIAQKLQKGCDPADESRVVIALVCSVFTSVSSKLLPVLHLKGIVFVILPVAWPCFYFLADTFPWP